MRSIVLSLIGLWITICVSYAQTPTERLTRAQTDQPNAPLTIEAQRAKHAALLPAGYLTTRGNQIIDQSGRPVRLACVGYFAPRNVPDDISGMANAGFNCVRYPWFNATLMSQLGQMDQIVAESAKAGLKVIFDHHGNETPAPNNGFLPYPCNGLPIDKGPGTNGTDDCGDTGTVDLARFVSDWSFVAKRYSGNTTVIGFDLTNEPHLAASTWRRRGGSTWADGSPTDLKIMYERAGNAIQQVNPGVLIICEGIGRYGDSLSDGTPLLAPGIVDLSFINHDPVTLHIPGQVVYSIHDYPASIGAVRPDSGVKKIAAMTAAWGYLVTQQIAPVWIGEMGASLDGDGPDSKGSRLAEEQAWAKTLVDYINGANGAQGGPSFTSSEQAIGTTWLAWGNLDGQSPDGTLNSRGELRAQQKDIYWQLRFQAPPDRPGKPISTGAPR